MLDLHAPRSEEFDERILALHFLLVVVHGEFRSTSLHGSKSGQRRNDGEKRFGHGDFGVGNDHVKQI